MAEMPNPASKTSKTGSGEGKRPEQAAPEPAVAPAGPARRRHTQRQVERRGITSGYEEPSAERRVQEQLRTIFRGRIPTEAGDIVSALNRLFPRKQGEGKTEYAYAPQALGAIGDLGRGLSATQASLFARAQAMLTDSKARLETLKPQQAAADSENVQAVRLLVLQECSELVDELGRSGGPRVDRVDTLFEVLVGGESNLLTRLGEEFGLTRDQVQTVEENENLISYRILLSEWEMLFESWKNLNALQEGDFGVQSGKLFRELKLLGTSVDDVENVLDQAGVDVTDREELLVGENDLTLDGLLAWIRHVGVNEGAQAIKDGGRMGVTALMPTLHKLSALLGELPDLEQLNEEDVDDALTALRGHLEESITLARQIAPDAADGAALAEGSGG